GSREEHLAMNTRVAASLNSHSAHTDANAHADTQEQLKIAEQNSVAFHKICQLSGRKTGLDARSEPSQLWARTGG
ncbi:hypothetical protein KUCAC02_022920, partial [Chaenocephalus aceratus]